MVAHHICCFWKLGNWWSDEKVGRSIWNIFNLYYNFMNANIPGVFLRGGPSVL